jgi:hypothetical protein
VQTTLIPSGGAAMASSASKCPGTYLLVDHSLFRTFNKGALAMLKAEGAEDKAIYSGKEVDYTYIGDRAAGNLKPVRRGTGRRRHRHADQGAAGQGRRVAVRRHLLDLPPARRQGHGGRVPAAGEVGLPGAGPRSARSESCCMA